MPHRHTSRDPCTGLWASWCAVCAQELQQGLYSMRFRDERIWDGRAGCVLQRHEWSQPHQHAILRYQRPPALVLPSSPASPEALQAASQQVGHCSDRRMLSACAAFYKGATRSSCCCFPVLNDLRVHT